MSNTEWLDILNYSLIGLNIIIACVILNWTLCFSLLSRSQCLKPRRPVISILIGAFNVIFCGIDRSQVLLHANLTTPIIYPGWRFVNAVCVQFWILTMFLMAYRAWIIYYSIKFNKSLKDKQWRLYINPAENDWFLKKRKSYGNSKKTMLPFMIVWLITASIYWFIIIKYQRFTSISRLIIMIQTLIVIFFLTFIWYKIPKFHDIWRIRNELIITIRLFVFGMGIFIVLAVLFQWEAGNWKYALLSSLGTVSALSIGYAVLYYPLSSFNLPCFVYGALIVNRLNQSLSKEMIEIATASHKKKEKLYINIDKQPSTKQWGKQFYKLKAILRHKDGFRLFAGHLMKEYAIEHLLFFVETSQWLEYMKQKCVEDDITLSVVERASQIEIKFHKNVPKSRIVCWQRSDNDEATLLSSSSPPVGIDNESVSSGHTLTAPSGTLTHAQQLTIDLNMDEFELAKPIDDPWMQCIKLFRKYVINGSYFCINISGETRITLYELIGYDTVSTKCDEELVEILKENCNNDMDKLFHIFDNARDAVFRLMIWAVSRFETSDTYLQHFMPYQPEAK